ncbi:MAG: MFS transporter [Promethearchaeota archaeon]
MSEDISPLKKTQKIFFLLVLIITFFVNFDSAVVIPIMANYAIQLGASLFMAGLIVGIYSIVHIPSNIIFGRLVDKFSRKVFLSLGILLDGVSMFLYFIANTTSFLLIARIIHALGGGFGGPATMSYIGDSVSKEKSGRGMALYGIAVGFSMLFGFIIGGFLASFFGYKEVFFTIAIIMIAVTFISIFIKSSYKPIPQKLSLKKEFRILRSLFMNKYIIIPYLSILALFFNLGIITGTYTVELKIYNFTDAQIGMLLAFMVIFSLLIHYPAGILSDKIGMKKVISLGLLITSCSFLFLIFPQINMFPIIGMIFFGLGHGLIFPTTAGTIKIYSDTNIRGIATGLFYSFTVGGVALGSPISGFFSQYFNFQIAVLLGFIIPSLVLIIVFMVKIKF